ncbi:UDP-N-acetylmuramoyl-L-alanine--D-glutamate ligase [Myxococcaceae bacterium GXIMD 01537]
MTPALSGRKVLVFGLAKSGLAAIKLLLARGARVTALDGRDEAALGDVARELRAQGVSLVTGRTPPGLLELHELVVVSPGVPLALPEIQAARAAGVPVWGEVELAWRFLSGVPLFGITGTNGKSTTTALTGELFAQGGGRTFVGGNLGRPFAEAALTPEGWDSLVVELSSFQLEGIEGLRARGAAILNLTPDHIDRYASHEAYGEAKARLFLNQGEGDFAVVNADDAHVLRLARRAKVPVYGFTSTRTPQTLAGAEALAGVAYARPGGFAFSMDGGRREEHYTLSNRALRGAHNAENAMAAALLARLGGVEAAAVQRGLDAYPGLPHRMESVRVLDGVEWVNDSKATNVDSVLVALRAFPGNLLLIAGGKGKGAPYQPMVEAGRGKVKAVLTIGQDAETIETAYRNEAPVHACGTLERAVARARELARAGDVVLLSPACASYDQFQNFEHRGDTFKRLVTAL